MIKFSFIIPVYWPGEDAKLCLDLVKSGGKILYNPKLIVYHRRPGLFRHLKQQGGYGLHRGFFAKRYPETSFRFKYFILSIFFSFCFVWRNFKFVFLLGKNFIFSRLAAIYSCLT